MNNTLPRGVTAAQRQVPTPDEQYQKYVLGSHTNYRDLHKKHSLEEVGIWHVVGEGDEVGRGATIGYYEGKLEHVIRYAVLQDRFWSYGTGGHITKLDVKPITAQSVQDQAELKAEKAKLEEELARINSRLKEIS